MCGGLRRIASPTVMMLAIVLGFGCRSRPAEVPGTLDRTTLRTLSQGSLVGFSTEDGAHAWRGIPFAEPPLGELRWRAPRAPGRWDGTLEAVSHAASCMQFAGPGGGRDGAKSGRVPGSEVCLYLSVCAP